VNELVVAGGIREQVDLRLVDRVPLAHALLGSRVLAEYLEPGLCVARHVWYLLR
jgi:hypothetical protein